MQEINALLTAMNNRCPVLYRTIGRYITYDETMLGCAAFVPHSIKMGRELFEKTLDEQVFILTHESIHLRYAHDNLLEDLIEDESEGWKTTPLSDERTSVCEMAVDLVTNQIVRCYLGSSPDFVHLPGVGAYALIIAVPDIHAFIHQRETALAYAMTIERNEGMLADIATRYSREMVMNNKATPPGESAAPRG